MIEGENVVDSMISPLKCSSNDKSTFGVNFPQEQDLETEIVHSVSRKSDTDRIMSYVKDRMQDVYFIIDSYEQLAAAVPALETELLRLLAQQPASVG